MVCLKNFFSTALLASTALALPASLPRGTSSGKRGAAYNDASSVQALDGNNAISWAYNWGAAPNGDLPSGVEFVPMLWGMKTVHDFVASVEALISGGNTKYVMGFNEPDVGEQAGMSPADAASKFLQFVTPYLGSGMGLVSPAVTSSTSPGSGLDWLRDFLGGCSQCGINVLAVHWYGNTADELKSFMQEAIDLANAQGMQEVWLTEFALSEDVSSQGCSSTSAEFLREVLPWLDGQDMVTRYSYFWAQEGFLVEGGGPSEAGQVYSE